MTAQRQSIESLEVEVHSTTIHAGGSVPETDWNGRFWIGGGKLRCDRTVACTTEETARNCTATDCFNCIAPNLHVYFSTASPFPGARYSVTVSDLSQLPAQYDCPDVRWCGLNPSSFLETPQSSPFNLEDLARYEPMAALSDAVLDGEPCRLIEYVFPGTTQRFWVRPNPSPFILRAEVEWGLGGRRVVQTLSASPWTDPDTGIVLPRTITFERLENSERTTREVTRIDVLSINEPIDPKVFDLKGITSIPKSTEIHWVSTARPPFSGRMVWDGEQIVAGPALTQAVSQSPLPRRRSMWIWLLVANGVALSTIGVVLIVRARRSASGERDSRRGSDTTAHP